MKKYRDGATTHWRTLLVVGGLTAAMQVSVAQTKPLSVGMDASVQELPLSQTLDLSGQSAPARLANAVRKVKAPPRPPGSDKVVVGVGLNPVELKRQKMAHSAEKMIKKDPTRDDSLDLMPVLKKP